MSMVAGCAVVVAFVSFFIGCGIELNVPFIKELKEWATLLAWVSSISFAIVEICEGLVFYDCTSLQRAKIIVFWGILFTLIYYGMSTVSQSNIFLQDKIFAHSTGGVILVGLLLCAIEYGKQVKQAYKKNKVFKALSNTFKIGLILPITGLVGGYLWIMPMNQDLLAFYSIFIIVFLIAMFGLYLNRIVTQMVKD